MNKVALNKNLEALAKNREDTAKLNAEYIEKLELEIERLKIEHVDLAELELELARTRGALRVIAWPLLHTEAEREAHIEILLKYLNDRQPEGRRVVALPGECYLRALIGVAAIGLKREQR